MFGEEDSELQAVNSLARRLSQTLVNSLLHTIHIQPTL